MGDPVTETPEQLITRIVRAGATAVALVIVESAPPNIVPTLPPGCTAMALSEAVSVAVLRQLAESEALLEDFGGDFPEALRGLAVSIEKGE